MTSRRCDRLSVGISAIAVFLLTALLEAAAAHAATWTVVGWNNLGMHCTDPDFSLFSLLPPYNTIHAQVIDPQGHLVTDPTAVTVTYQAIADPDGSINTTSVGKLNFWQYVQSLFGVALAPDAGLAGKNMPGTSNQPQPMSFDPTAGWFIAEGIPITPYDDAGVKNYYPMMRLVARDAGGNVLATTDIVLPVSDEMDCKSCHASGSASAAQPSAGWANNPDPKLDVRENILLLHDDRQAGDPVFVSALQAAGYNAAGLHATAIGGTSILCANCHSSAALGTTGKSGVKALTAAMHGLHGNVNDPLTGLTLDATANRSACYRCHPGSLTRCLRGAMGSAVAADGTLAMQCQSCHGSMSAVGSPARLGWLQEPACQNCHTGTAVNNSGQIRYTSVFDTSGQPRTAADSTFATTPNAPAAGISLYRFSTGHGGLKCEACHGSTHAEFPASHRNDNIQSIEHQGHVGMFVECASCHGAQPVTANGGPHGMHSIGQAWVNAHPAAVAQNGGPSACQACHGADYRGTVLSRAQADRVLSGEFGTKQTWRGFQIGCYTCHSGPSNDDPNPNRAPIVTNASVLTPTDTAVTVTLAARDPDGDALTLRIVSQPAHGTVGLSGSTATYFPDAGFSGKDQFTFAAWDGSTDSNLGSVTVGVGAAGIGPDLSGEWLSAAQRCVTRCTVTGQLLITNSGTAKAGASVVAFYLSPTPTLASGAVPAKQLRVPVLKGGRSARRTFSLRLPAGASATGQYLIAVVDATNAVPETDETNNVSIYGPLG